MGKICTMFGIPYNEEETITVNDITIEIIPLWKWLLKTE